MATQKNRKKHFIHLSYKDAKKMSLQRYSCIKEIEQNITLPMSPRYLCSLRVGIKNILDKKLFVYNSELNGVALAYDKIKICSSNIIDDQDFFSLTIKVLFLVFNCEVSSIICGVVNKVADYHFGCLIHKCINGSIRRPNYADLNESQRDNLNGVREGDEMIFQVKKIEKNNVVLFVVGEVAPEHYRCPSSKETSHATKTLFNGNNDRIFESPRKLLSTVTIKKEIYSPEKKKRPVVKSSTPSKDALNTEKVKRKKVKREPEFT